MTPTTLTIWPHELEPGDIIVEHLGLRVGGFDPPSLLLYDNKWWVWSSTDKLICILPADAVVEVIRNVDDEIVAEEDGQEGSSPTVSPTSSATPDDCPPRGIARVRGLLMVVR